MKNVAIVGAGPGGLTLARLLQMNQFEVKVYERDAGREIRVQGATLDLHEDSGLRALAAAGLTEEFKKKFRPGADRLRLMDRGANVVYEYPGDFIRPEIDRGPLRDLLLDSLKPGTVVWDHQLTAYENGELKFKNGARENVDLVIAADGANSKLRGYVTARKPEYCGFALMEGAVSDAEVNSPHIHRLLNGGKIFAFGENKSLIVAAKGDGSYNYYFGFKAPPMRTMGLLTRDFAMSFYTKEFAGWSPFWLELFERADPKFILRPLFHAPLDQTWDARDDLTLIGDAAHVMPPYAGEGVNMAMLDALELAEALKTSPYAIAEYESRMRPRAAEAVKMSLEQTAALHAPNALEHMLNIMNVR